MSSGKWEIKKNSNNPAKQSYQDHQELMQDIKSIGVFLNFMVRYPTFYYGTVDTYRSGVDPG